MSAMIIPFPSKKKEEVLIESQIKKVKFDTMGVPNIKGVPVQAPTNGIEYLEICKQFLDPMDYQDILCGIMDKEHYDALEPELRNVVDSYYDFPK